MNAVLQGRQAIRNYCIAYDAIMHGYETGLAGSPGAAAAHLRLESLSATMGAPVGALAAAAKNSNLDFKMQVYGPVREQTRQALVAKYANEHAVKTFLTDLVGAERGGPLVINFDLLVTPERFPDE